MTANRLKLVGPRVLVFIATAEASLAQNTGNPMLSGNSTILPARSELSVSPALASSGLLSNSTTGTNPLTGLPCARGPARCR